VHAERTRLILEMFTGEKISTVVELEQSVDRECRAEQTIRLRTKQTGASVWRAAHYMVVITECMVAGQAALAKILSSTHSDAAVATLS
jgi:hypothetical protein